MKENRRNISLSRKLAGLNVSINLRLPDYVEYGLISLRAKSKKYSSSVFYSSAF